MKGFINHLKESHRRLVWELAREKNGTEVPWLAAPYRKWLTDVEGKTPATVNAYLQYLKKLDREVFMQPCEESELVPDTYSADEDFFYLLDKYLMSNCFDDVEELFDDYLKLIDEELKLAKEGDSHLNPKNLNDWRSAFKSYKKFFMEWMIPMMKDPTDKGKQEKANVLKSNRYQTFYCEDMFVDWMHTDEGMSMRSAQSYVSNIKGVNRDIFSKNKKGMDLLDYVGSLFFNNKEAKAIELLIGMEELLTRCINAKDDSTMPLSRLSDSRSAFRKYVRFIQEEMLCYYEDEEEATEQTETNDELMETSTNSIVYEYGALETNFRFRLMTQNRFGEILYPISLLKRLFALCQDAPYKWFESWLDDSIAEIKVLTDKGDYLLADIDELAIDSQSKKVTVMLSDRQEATVWTETETGERVPMSVDKLRDIHIDHTPLISSVLADNAPQLPALCRFTEIVRECARRVNVSVEKKNFSIITPELFLDSEISCELEKMIPALKDELNLIREKTTLTLMAAAYNLRKKK